MSTIVENLYKRSDKLIKDWMSNDFPNTDTYKNDPFLTVQKKPNDGLLKPEYIDLMPEPFFGNPEDENLAVILNLNPGYGPNNKDYIGKNKVKDRLNQGYSIFAKTNPYLTDDEFHPDAYDWWQKRLCWLQDLEGHKSDKLPFVMELCPWHSHKWGDARINHFSQEQKDYIEKNVLLPAAYGAKRSKLGFIISIGKVYTKLYENLDFECQKEWGPNSGTNEWPISSKTRKPKHVYFAYYNRMIDGETIKVLSVWLRGSNKTPCKDFLGIEKDIIEYIKTH